MSACKCSCSVHFPTVYIFVDVYVVCASAAHVHSCSVLCFYLERGSVIDAFIYNHNIVFVNRCAVDGFYVSKSSIQGSVVAFFVIIKYCVTPYSVKD